MNKEEHENTKGENYKLRKNPSLFRHFEFRAFVFFF